MDNTIVIWGTGQNAELAYYYYKNKKQIQFFVDSDCNKWGSDFHGIEIKSPNDIRKDNKVVVAVKNGYDEIRKYIQNVVGIGYVEHFTYNVSIDEKCDSVNIYDKNSFIIKFSGGLGNQMFQYALAKSFQCQGKNVYGDICDTKKSDVRDFLLKKVFHNILLSESNSADIDRLVLINKDKQDSGCFLIYKEKSIFEESRKSVDKIIMNMTGGIIEGFFQSSYFADRIKDELRRDFVFDIKKDNNLMKMCYLFDKEEIVSVHVRRGDYLDKAISYKYENICTELYYKNAINLIRAKKPGIRICFFSDDVEWVKANLKYENSFFVEKSSFGTYEDWYDMCLMSHCKHNIIANSTFSWWGAWLNCNEDKIVIAPKKWVNQCDYLDIYPDGWIKVDG